MAVVTMTPGVDGLGEAVDVLREWQHGGRRCSCIQGIWAGSGGRGRDLTVRLSPGCPQAWQRVWWRCGPAATLEAVDLVMRERLRAEGYSDHELRRMLRSGELSALRPGAYLTGPAPDGPAARHLLAVRAAVAALSADAVVSHESAAVVHGLPVWGLALDVVHVTRARRRSGGRCGSRVHVHSSPLDPDEIVLVDGIRVTSVARTLVDLARHAEFEQTVVTADAALHRHLVDRAILDAALDRRPRMPGLPGARRALAFADARSPNPGESRSRVAIARAGLPAPELQWEVRTAIGLLVGRVDFGWPALRTLGEFDGRVKYGRDLRPGQDPVEVLYEEKLREDALRGEDLGMVRWGWVDLGSRFAPVARRLQNSFRPTVHT